MPKIAGIFWGAGGGGVGEGVGGLQIKVGSEPIYVAGK